MIITYRVTSTQWPHHVGEGKVRRYKTPEAYTRLCPAQQPSECDWLVPNLVNPYAVV